MRILLLLLVAIGLTGCCSMQKLNKKKYTFLDYYEYAEILFYDTHTSWVADEKKDVCLTLALQLQSRNEDLKKLKSELRPTLTVDRTLERQYQDYRQWCYVNGLGFLTEGYVNGFGGKFFEKVKDYKSEWEWYRMYFNIPLSDMERKWKGKPKPAGLDEYLLGSK